LDDEDIILVPSLFETVSGCGPYVAALIPATVNLTVYNPDDGGPVHLFIPDPYLRSDIADQSSDPLIQWYADNMPSGIELHFVDNWFVYHLALGEVHCGSNTRRTPPADLQWWTDASHLSTEID